MSGLHFRDRNSPALSPCYRSKIGNIINNLPPASSHLVHVGGGRLADWTMMILSDGNRLECTVTNYLAPALLLCWGALAGAQLGSDGFYLFGGNFRNIGGSGGRHHGLMDLHLAEGTEGTGRIKVFNFIVIRLRCN